MRISKRLLCILTILVSANPHPQCALADPAEVTASQHQPVYPALIRRETNVLCAINVVASADGVMMQRMTFELQGTDNIKDLAGVTLFVGGPDGQFTTESSVASANEPANKMHFVRDHPLKKGNNWFWLSGKISPEASLLNYVDVACTEIETSSGIVNPQDMTPGMRIRIGYALCQHMDYGTHTYRIPAIARTKDGSLLAVYDMRHNKSRDLQEDIDIGLSKSTDGGQTWSRPRPIMDRGVWGGLPQEQNGVSDPGIIVDYKTGKIFCFAVWMYGKPGKHQWNEDGSEPGFEIGKAAQFVMATSRDDGESWSKLKNLTRSLKREEWVLFAPSPQGGITLRDGTLVQPSQGRDPNGDPFSTIMYSKNHGRTWTVGNPAFIGSSENQAVELSDGSIMLNMRSERSGVSSRRSVYVTKDLGKTWAPHQTNQKDLVEPHCNGSTLRVDYMEDGKSKSVLLFANPQSEKRRENHTIQVSFDEGKTWPESHRRMIDQGLGFGYPSLVQIDDKHVGIVFEGSRSHIMFMKFTIDELVNP